MSTDEASAEEFARRALRQVRRGDAVIVVPAWWKAWWYLERASPSLSLRFAKRLFRELRGMQPTAS